ncbi:MAG: hypothetical protein V1806_04865 [Pseudomonadota bacterium]
MQGNQNGPPGLEDWEELYPELFARHGGPITLAVALADAPAVVQELVALSEAHGLALSWDGRAVILKEADKAQAAQAQAAVTRCVDIVADHQEELRTWLAPLIR